MKIALLTDGIHPYVVGGMQKHSFYLAKFLALKGIKVDLYHTYLNPEYQEGNLSVFNADELKNIEAYSFKFPPPSKIPGHYIRRSFHYSELIFEQLIEKINEYDFIYIKGFSGWKLLKEKKNGLSTPPVGIKFHGLNMFQKSHSLKSFFENRLLVPPVTYNMQQADYNFSYGGKITDIIHKVGIPKDTIIEIPTGITDDWIIDSKRKNENEKTNFLFIGRYDKVKGVIALQKALLELTKTTLPFKFHFIGPIPSNKKIQNPSIVYHGQITDKKKLQLIIDECDVLVLPSHSEGMPNVIIEAMARGLAIIATDVGAINMLVSEKNGWLLENSNSLTIKKAMVKAIQSSNLEIKQQQSMEKVKKELRWESTIDILVDKIQQITSN